MRRLSATVASTGIAIGPVRLLPPRIDIAERHVATDHLVAEVGRFDAAVATTDAAMAGIGTRTDATDLGEEFVDVHRAILRSDELIDATRRLIRERSLGAEWAVRLVVNQMGAMFAEMKDERLRERVSDLEQVADRLLRTLLDLPELRLDERMAGAVGVGAELSPIDALQMHRLGIAGFVTERGGPTSHAAILARALGIPYAFGVHGIVDAVRSGDMICFDGGRGEVVVRPDDDTRRDFERRRDHEKERAGAVAVTQHAPSVTRDGTPVSLGANIESADEVAAALAAGADHIGLVRTELLYLDRPALPSEDEQLDDALAILRAADGRPVTFRTLDIGGDKLPSGVRISVGPNPALGLRGIRFSLDRPDIFRAQLRALYRAAAAGPLRILLPLVTQVSELRAAREVCTQVCAELRARGVAHDATAPIGAMIETPSAVLTADHIAAESDFLSVGTNDLIQYTFAADRDNADMADLDRPMHPSILRALAQVFAAAAAAGKPVSVCGDMAGDPWQTWSLLGLGLRSFSMTMRQIPVVKSVVLKTDVAAAEDFVRAALARTSAEDVASLAAARFGDLLALELDGRAPRRAR